MSWVSDQVDRVTSAVSDTLSDVGEAARSAGRFVDDWAVPTALAMFANPLIAQDLMGAAALGALSRGADPRTALIAGMASPMNAATGGDTQYWQDVMAFNAALAGGAATAGMGTGLMFTSPAAAAAGMAPLGMTSAGLGMTALGVGVGAGVYAGAQAIGGNFSTGEYDTPSELPPDLADMYTNDPNQALQFQRMRKSARMLGRAGTFRSTKGSMGGSSGDFLGGQASLVGT